VLRAGGGEAGAESFAANEIMARALTRATNVSTHDDSIPPRLLAPDDGRGNRCQGPRPQEDRKAGALNKFDLTLTRSRFENGTW
jgi:hypothetical protein